MVIEAIDREVEEELEDSDPQLLGALRRRRTEKLNRKYPEPELQDILAIRDRLRTRFSNKHDEIRRIREQRYLHDSLSAKMQEKMRYGDRYHSGLTFNEIRLVAGLLTTNRPEFEVLPSGAGENAAARADQQTRWGNEWLPAMEREFGAIYYPAADALAEANYCALHLYITGNYDGVDSDLDKREGESAAHYRQRQQRLLVQIGAPIGLTVPDPLATLYDSDEHIVVFDERKSRRQVYRWIADNLGAEAAEEWRNPRIGTAGANAQDGALNDTDSLECLTYYDDRWLAYVVGGKLVREPEEHGFARNPVVILEGYVSGSRVLEERLAGMVYGQLDDELFINRYLTAHWDITQRTQVPLIMYQATDARAREFVDARGEPLNIGMEAGTIIPAGYQIVDATKDFRPRDIDPILGILDANFRRKGLNPVAQGEAPSANPSGFALSFIAGHAERPYEVLAESLARGFGEAYDIIRTAIRDHPDITAPWYLSAVVKDSKKGGTEWLRLGKDDIDETPARVSIDASSASSLAARVQVLDNGVQRGHVPRRLLQTKGYKLPDPSAADAEIRMDRWELKTEQLAQEQALRELAVEFGPPPGPPPGQIVGPNGDSSNGAGPPKPQGSTLGPELAAAGRSNPYAGQQPPGRVPPGEISQ